MTVCSLDSLTAKHLTLGREEIVNACGIDDFHDGVNYTRTSCVIAVSKAKAMFEPFLHQVRPQPVQIALVLTQILHLLTLS